ncbi:hypothetical protein HZB02_05075 [Candidatus Woesearchaeota archaeon]|nr:hypothetical protein [Candidatus Woesearchaeota archaeon]
MHKKVKHIEHVGDIAKELGKHDQAEEWYKKAIRGYVKLSWFEQAMGLAKKAGHESQANDLLMRGVNQYEQEKLHLRAARLCEENGMVDRAIENFIKAGYMSKAAALEAKRGNLALAKLYTS